MQRATQRQDPPAMPPLSGKSNRDRAQGEDNPQLPATVHNHCQEDMTLQFRSLCIIE